MREESNRGGQIGPHPAQICAYVRGAQFLRLEARSVAPGLPVLPTGRLQGSAAASVVVTMGSQARRRGGLETKLLNAKQLRSDRGNGISIVANRFGCQGEG